MHTALSIHTYLINYTKNEINATIVELLVTSIVVSPRPRGRGG
jgi:hypothetical protein